jgi:hypothetical protein
MFVNCEQLIFIHSVVCYIYKQFVPLIICNIHINILHFNPLTAKLQRQELSSSFVKIKKKELCAQDKKQEVLKIECYAWLCHISTSI